jgi:hypothetical protein
MGARAPLLAVVVVVAAVDVVEVVDTPVAATGDADADEPAARFEGIT